jgi:hypothetical protein
MNNQIPQKTAKAWEKKHIHKYCRRSANITVSAFFFKRITQQDQHLYTINPMLAPFHSMPTFPQLKNQKVIFLRHGPGFSEGMLRPMP